MADAALPSLLIIANPPGALTELGGISLVERIRRLIGQLGFRQATILSNSFDVVRAHMERQSWHAEDVSLRFQRSAEVTIRVSDALAALPSNERPVLVILADYCFDGRLLRALTQAQPGCALIDSNPPANVALFWEDHGSSSRTPGAAVLTREWLAQKDSRAEIVPAIVSDLASGGLTAVDTAQEPGYIPDMRRSIRPFFFPAPIPERRALAERFLRDTTQKGILDLPARAHAPIEKWILAHLARTLITPNQVTLTTGMLGVIVTALYFSGHIWLGVLLALVVGVLDGVDGKLARLKIQTTKAGKGEHVLDYCLEMSWWVALAFHFHNSGRLGYAYTIWIAFFVFDVLDRLAKRSVEQHTGRSIDDVTPFDRLLRSVAGRRNIYTWLFALCLLLGQPALGFVLLCSWGITTSAIHLVRAVQIRTSAS